MATCDALDMIIAGRNVELGNCTRNSLCTSFMCVAVFDSSVIVTTNVTINPCAVPISVSIFSFVNVFGVVLDATVSESQNITGQFSRTDVILNQTDAGILFQVSTFVAFVVCSVIRISVKEYIVRHLRHCIKAMGMKESD